MSTLRKYRFIGEYIFFSKINSGCTIRTTCTCNLWVLLRRTIFCIFFFFFFTFLFLPRHIYTQWLSQLLHVVPLMLHRGPVLKIGRKHTLFHLIYLSLCMRKPKIWSSDQVQNKPGCTVTEAGYKLEISNLQRRRIVLSTQQKQRC